MAATLFGGPQWPAHHFAHAPHAAADPGALASAFAAGGVSVVAAGAALAVLHGVNAFVAADADNDGDGEKEGDDDDDGGGGGGGGGGGEGDGDHGSGCESDA